MNLWGFVGCARRRIHDQNFFPISYACARASSRTCIPKVSDGWERIMRTLDLLPSLDTRKVIRHTLVRGLNFGYVDEYAKLDERADTQMVEPKGFVFVGGSRNKLSMANMPSFDEIMSFSTDLGERLGMEVLKQKPESRVTLLGHPGLETDVRKYYHLDE